MSDTENRQFEALPAELRMQIDGMQQKLAGMELFAEKFAALKQEAAEIERKVAALRAASQSEAVMMQSVTESRSPAVGTEETLQTGLRTERVTLEIIHDEAGERVREMIGGMISRTSSVRVIPQSEADAEVERLRNTRLDLIAKRDQMERERDRYLYRLADVSAVRDAVIDEAKQVVAERDALKARVAELEKRELASDSRDAVQADAEPVAFLVDGPFEKRAFRTREEVYAYTANLPEIEKQSRQLVPLYRAPPPPRGWLSQREREALTRAQWSGSDMDSDADCVAELLSSVTDTEPRGWLTKEEREAVKWAAEVAGSLAECGGAGVPPGERCAYEKALSGLLSRVTDTESRGWLTGEQLTALHIAADNLVGMEDGDGEPLDAVSTVLRSIVACNSPPTVRLPRSINVEGPGALSWHETRRIVAEALAKAGVPVEVKE